MSASSPTFTRTFFRDFIIALIALTIVGVGPVIYFTIQAQKDVSEAIIERSTQAAMSEFQAVGSTLSGSVRIARQWAQSGMLSLEDPESMNHLLFPLIREEQPVFGISIADTDGRSYYINREGSQIRTRFTSVENGVRQETIRFWNQDVSSEPSTAPSKYDPRGRPWFFPALGSDDVHWTDAYIFYTEKTVGVTASSSVSIGDTDDYQLVVAFDLSLQEVYNRIHELQPSPNSQVVILRRDEAVYSPGIDAGPEFLSIEDTTNELIRKAHSAWSRDPLDERSFQLSHENQRWWCGFYPSTAFDAMHGSAS